LYFSSQRIPSLANYSLKERQAILAIAEKLTTPEKLIINIIKLLVLIPAFIYLARLQHWSVPLLLALLWLSYLVIMRPIILMFTQKYLTSAIKLYQQQIK